MVLPSAEKLISYSWTLTDGAATILEIDGRYTRGKRILKGLESTLK